MFILHILRRWLMITVVLKLSLWIVTFLCLFSWHVLITHSQGFAEGMWLSGITACLLPIDGVKQRTTSLLPHDHNPLDLHHHHHYHHLLPSPRPNPPTGSQQTATSEEVLLVPCRRATKQAAQGPNTPPPPTPLTSVSPSSLLFHPLKSLPVCFSMKRKLKPVGFVFLLLLAKCLLLKPRCWQARSHLSEKHEVDHSAMGEEWRGVGVGAGQGVAVGVGADTAGFWCLHQVWMFHLPNQLDGLSAASQTVTNTFLFADLLWT